MKVKSKTFFNLVQKDVLGAATDFASSVGKEHLVTITENHGFIRIWYWDDDSSKIKELEKRYQDMGGVTINPDISKMLKWIFATIIVIFILMQFLI